MFASSNIRVESIVAMYFFAITFLLCSAVINGQPQPANFVLHSTKTDRDLIMGESEDTIQSWATWACTLSMKLESYESRWFNGSNQLSRSGRTIIQDSRFFVDGQTPGTAVLIQNLTYLDQGAYDCQVRSTDPLTSWVSLTVTLTLVTNLSPIATVVETYDDSFSVEVSCDMSGYIPPDNSLYWIVDGEDIRSNGTNTNEWKYRITYRDGVRKAQVGGSNPTFSRVSVLTIYDVELSDAKTYSCAVDGTSLMEEVNLIVNEAASPRGSPQNVQVEVVSSTAVLVNWEEVLVDQRQGNITHYEVLCSQTKFKDIPPLLKLTDGPVLSLLIDSLEEFVEYNISIRAYTIVGPGPFSPLVVVQTPEDGPTGAPMRLQVVARGENRLDVSWSKPDKVLINGILCMYVIKYCIVSDSGMLPSLQLDCDYLNVTGNTTQVVLTNLTTETLYNVSVAAYTIEIGPFSSVIKRTGLTTESDDRAPPTETKTHKSGYSVIGIVVGVIVVTVVLVVITGIVYLGVTYQCKKKQMLSELIVGDDHQGSTVSVSLSKDPELVLIPMGDGIALMRQLSAGPSISSVEDETDSGVHDRNIAEALDRDSAEQTDGGNDNNEESVPASETVSIQIPTLKPLSDSEVPHPQLENSD